MGRKRALINGLGPLQEGHKYLQHGGASSLGLKHLTGLSPTGAAVVLARRCGPPNVHYMSEDELVQAEDDFLERVRIYFENLHA